MSWLVGFWVSRSFESAFKFISSNYDSQGEKRGTEKED